MNVLSIFQSNEPTRDAVKLFMIETLKDIAVDKAFGGEDTKGIPEAKLLIDKMFEKLADIYGKKDAPIIDSTR